MKKIYLFFSVFLLALTVVGQTYVELTDDMEIPSNSNIKILGGDYVFGDYGWDGVIRIVNKENIILDGDSVTVQGGNEMGYMIKIENSSNIVIKNFELVSKYKYALHCINSDHIMLEGNNFSYNKKDTTGWIQIWTPYTSALGGGALFYNTHFIDVGNNVMTQQNDGVAMYECDTGVIWNNVMNWNCGFGVRMNFTDHMWVHHNDLSHVNRETNPSDCAAILLIVSNENLVEYNNLTYSGDGIFLGQYEYSQIPNNNEFYYNECSYSPHNAIEATFADGNIYKHNQCNYSHYGFWLGYSFNSVVDSNEIIGNQVAGVAVDRGYNNRFTGNTIKENPTGIDVWEGDGIPPYQMQFSKDYFLYGNLFEGNEKAVKAVKTEHLIAKENHFLNNRSDLYFQDDSFDDTISDNVFEGTAVYYFENRSTDDIYAVNNLFVWDDDDLTGCKIYDKEDVTSYGEVIWQPHLAGDPPVYQDVPPEDMAEPDAVWYTYPEACGWYGLMGPTTTGWDYEIKKVGQAAIHLNTVNGWDMGMMYRPPQNERARWNLTEEDTLVFWLRSENTTGYGFQFCHIKLGNNCGGYFKYTAPATTILNPTMGAWKQYKVPLTGVSPWVRSAYGDVSLSDISYVEFHADTWEYGFELWIDGMTFTPFVTGTDRGEAPAKPGIEVTPNPSGGTASIVITGAGKREVQMNLYDARGRMVKRVFDGKLSEGRQNLWMVCPGLQSGIYLLNLITDAGMVSKKIVIEK